MAKSVRVNGWILSVFSSYDGRKTIKVKEAEDCLRASTR